MKVDKTINVGTVIHFIGVIVTLVVLYTGVVTRLTTLETKVDAMWSWFAVKINQLDGGQRDHR